MTAAHGYSPNKDNYTKRLRRIEGQVRGIAKMIDEDKYCIDVLTQISAVNSALQSVALGLLEEHLGHCVTHAVAEGGDEADKKLAEASAAMHRSQRGGASDQRPTTARPAARATATRATNPRLARNVPVASRTAPSATGLNAASV